MTEINSTRKVIKEGFYKGEYKGKFKQSSISLTRSSFVNSFLNMKEENKKINEIMRNRIIGNFTNDKDLKIWWKINKLLDTLGKEKPDSYNWKYKRNDMKKYKKQIDEITNLYIDTYYKDDFKELVEMLKKQDKNYQKAYGKDINRNYEKKKIDDFYARMGNKILNTCRGISKERKEKEQKRKIEYKRFKNYIKDASFHMSILSYDLKRIMQDMNNDYKKRKLAFGYEMLEEEIEREKEMEMKLDM